MNTIRREQGQVLVLIVLAIVGMLGFAALAVDLGRVFSERRRAQNAADAAVLAAANAGSDNLVNSTSARTTAAIAAANASLLLNDYVDGGVNNNDDGTSIEININYPPKSGYYANNYDYYQVTIYQDVEKVFSHFVFGGLLDFTVEAVAKAVDATGGLSGYPIAALCTDCCPGLNFFGNSIINIKGGGAYSLSEEDGQNSCSTSGQVFGSNGNSCASGRRDGTSTVNFQEGYSVDLRGRWFDQSGTGGLYEVDLSGNNTSPQPPISELVNECQPAITVPQLPVPDCGEVLEQPDPSSVTGVVTMHPGTYEDLLRFNTPRQKIHFTSGLYCLKNGISVNGGIITGNNVMFFMEGGTFEMIGNSTVNIQAITDLKGGYYPDGPDADTLPDYDPDHQWGGMLIYMPYENDGGVIFSASSSSSIAGTIFAPGPRNIPGKCIISGDNGTIAVSSSIMCYQVDIGGGAEITIDYDPDENYKSKPSIGLYQ